MIAVFCIVQRHSAALARALRLLSVPFTLRRSIAATGIAHPAQAIVGGKHGMRSGAPILAFFIECSGSTAQFCLFSEMLSYASSRNILRLKMDYPAPSGRFWKLSRKSRRISRRYFAASRIPFPDQANEIIAIGAQGDTVLVEFWLTGTHLGPLRTPKGEIAPTGKAFRVRMMASLSSRPGRRRSFASGPISTAAL